MSMLKRRVVSLAVLAGHAGIALTVTGLITPLAYGVGVHSYTASVSLAGTMDSTLLSMVRLSSPYALY